MRRTAWRTAFAAMLALPIVAGCGDSLQVAGSTEPTHSGRLTVSLTGGQSAAAVQLLLRGEGITELALLDSTGAMFARRVDSAGTAYRVAIVGGRLIGALLTFAVPDISRADSYLVTLLEVADEDNGIRPSTSGYRLAVDRVR